MSKLKDNLSPSINRRHLLQGAAGFQDVCCRISQDIPVVRLQNEHRLDPGDIDVMKKRGQFGREIAELQHCYRAVNATSACNNVIDF